MTHKKDEVVRLKADDSHLKLWFKTRFSEFKLCGFYLCNDEKGAGKKTAV